MKVEVQTLSGYSFVVRTDYRDIARHIGNCVKDGVAIVICTTTGKYVIIPPDVARNSIFTVSSNESA